TVTGALDLDAADGGPLQLTHQVVADLPVLDHPVLVAGVLEPTRLPIRGDAEAEAIGVDLLAHYSLFSSPASASSPAAASVAPASVSAAGAEAVSGAV